MSPIRMQPSRLPNGDAPNVMNYPPGSTTTFEKGAVVTLSSGDVVEHGGGTTTTGIRGVSLEGVLDGTPDNPGDEVAVAIADRSQVFMGQAISGTTVQTDLSGITIGDQYGIVASSGDWYVDVADTTNVVLEIVDLDDDIDVVFFKFLEASLDAP